MSGKEAHCGVVLGRLPNHLLFFPFTVFVSPSVFCVLLATRTRLPPLPPFSLPVCCVFRAAGASPRPFVFCVSLLFVFLKVFFCFLLCGPHIVIPHPGPSKKKEKKGREGGARLFLPSPPFGFRFFFLSTRRVSSSRQRRFVCTCVAVCSPHRRTWRE